jgi:uncharacterized membrane protein YdfJ with MMPL/SSD domain
VRHVPPRAEYRRSCIVIAKTVAVGMTVALIIDASLVRVLLRPALMRLPGRLNWWAPNR